MATVVAFHDIQTFIAPTPKNKKRALFGSCPRTIDVAFSGTPPSQVRFGGCGIYSNPTPVNPPSSERSHIGYTFVYRYTIVTNNQGNLVGSGARLNSRPTSSVTIPL